MKNLSPSVPTSLWPLTICFPVTRFPKFPLAVVSFLHVGSGASESSPNGGPISEVLTQTDPDCWARVVPILGDLSIEEE